MTSSSVELVVRYAETDAQGIVHHANYLVWFEEGRSELLRRRGMPYSDIEKAGYCIVVAEAEVRFKSPAFYEDRVKIETTLQRARGKVLEFSYRAFNQTGTLLAEGKTRHVVLGPDRRPTPLPGKYLAPLLEEACVC